MKCPHCNQDHPDGTVFCPLTGNRIQMQSCQNPQCINYGKFNLPLDSKFCPDCGTPIEKRWSNIEDFRQGDIIIDCISLGITNLVETIKSGKYSIYDEDGKVSFMRISDGILSLTVHTPFEEIGNFVAGFADSDAFNTDFIFNSLKVFTWLNVDLDSPFFEEVGLHISNNFNNNVRLLQQNGYTRIKNILKADQNKSKAASFVCKTINSHGSYTFIVLYDDFMYIYDDVLTNWLPY